MSINIFTFSFFLMIRRHFLPSYVQTVRVNKYKPGSGHWNIPDLGINPFPAIFKILYSLILKRLKISKRKNSKLNSYPSGKIPIQIVIQAERLQTKKLSNQKDPNLDNYQRGMIPN